MVFAELNFNISRWIAMLILLTTLANCTTGTGQTISSNTQSLGSGRDSSSDSAATDSDEAQPEPLPLLDTSELNINVSEFDLSESIDPRPLVFENGDEVSITIWGYPELNRSAVIQPNGTITLPLIGEVRAAGLTVEQLREIVKEKLQPYSEVSPKELRHGDSLSLRVWQHPDLSDISVIEPDGMVTLPLIGRLQAANRTVEDVTADATQGIQAFIRDAQVTVIPTFSGRRTLSDFEVSVLADKLAPREIAVIGEVASQGLIPINGSLRLVEALAIAGVDQIQANLNSVVVIRNTQSDSPSFQSMRIGDFLDGTAPDQNIYLQNDDIVIVPRTFIAQVGIFVEQFFARTVPVFNFWTAIHSASVAREAAKSVELINESLRRGLLQITPQI